MDFGHYATTYKASVYGEVPSVEVSYEKMGPQTLTRVLQAVAPWARDSSGDTLALCVSSR